MHVSVIMTVFNEQQSIDRLLDSLAQQTRPPDEVVICDGGSTDATVQQIARWAARQADRLAVTVLVEPGANISRGRNAAIEHAAGPVIAVTDAGVRLDKDWLMNLTAPWAESDSMMHEAPLAAAGFFVADSRSVFEVAMAATVLPQAEEIAPQRFLPSSRSVAFLKTTWAAAGGYPEWLDYCEDLIFDWRVNALAANGGSAFVWRPDARVYFRPRGTVRAFWLQYYRYARGDGKADLWRKRHTLRYLVYLVAGPALVAMFVGGGVGRWLGAAGLAAGVVAYCRRPWQRLRRLNQGLTTLQRGVGYLLPPLIRLIGDCAKMAGYPVGLVWRWRNRSRKEIHWRRTLGQTDAAPD